MSYIIFFSLATFIQLYFAMPFSLSLSPSPNILTETHVIKAPKYVVRRFSSQLKCKFAAHTHTRKNTKSVCNLTFELLK